MFGVIDVSKNRLAIYHDLPSAISFFTQMNIDRIDEEISISIQPNVNNNNLILTTQGHHNFHTSQFEKYDLPKDFVISIGFLNKPEGLELFSILTKLDKDLIEKLFWVCGRPSEIFLRTDICDYCQVPFKVWDEERNSGYYGCVYNPTYYKVLPIKDLKDHHKFGVNLEPFLNKINFDHPDIFFLTLHGHFSGLSIASFPLPKDWWKGMVLCWNCVDKMAVESIWSH